MKQTILETSGDYHELNYWFKNINRCMLVCGKSIEKNAVNEYLKEIPSKLGTEIIKFSDFSPNPLYEDVVKGVNLFGEKNCDGIIAVGGGSAIDVAKCVKLYHNLGDGTDGAWLKAKIIPNDIKLMAIPTTAGSGSEATRFAVIYYKGNKQSVTDESIIPQTVLMDKNSLKTLPLYQRKATMCDALSHALESFWSVNSTEESRKYSADALKSALKHMDAYLNNTDEGNRAMLYAAHTAGRAINITQTTAGHAMCYKLTSLFKIAHGHAAILCNRVLFAHLAENADKREDLEKILREISEAMSCKTLKSAVEELKRIFDGLKLEIPKAAEEQYEILKNSVNPVRLKNHPLALTADDIDNLYRRILGSMDERL